MTKGIPKDYRIRKAMILAAGEGTRLRPLTYILPKPLTPVCNIPVMGYIISELRKIGVEEIYVNLYHKGEAIKEYFKDGSQYGVSIKYLIEDSLSGTAGAVKKLQWFFEGEDFIVVGGDDLIRINLEELVRFHFEKNAIATIGLYEVDDPSHYGVVITDEEGRIKEFQEKPLPEEALSNLANTGVYILNPKVFNYIKEIPYDFGKQVFPDLVKAGEPFYGLKVEGFWIDIGNLQTYKEANFLALEKKLFAFKENVYYSDLDEVEPGIFIGKGAVIGYRVKLEPPILIGRDVIIRPDTRIKGPAVIGDGSTIEGDLERVIVWPNQHVLGGRSFDTIIAGSSPKYYL